MTFESDEFHPQAARRLFLAVVNQAIFDVLENNEEAKAAEQWLLSEEFDNYSELLCWEEEVDRQGQQQSVA
jgi:hypothetical protein